MIIKVAKLNAQKIYKCKHFCKLNLVMLKPNFKKILFIGLLLEF
jgi:hypothetical protein